MPNIVKNLGWNRQLKSHDKAKKRLITRAEATEHDANKREKAADREARLQAAEALSLSFNSGLIPSSAQPPPPPRSLPSHSTTVELILDTPPHVNTAFLDSSIDPQFSL
jgi:hypothetical protein